MTFDPTISFGQIASFVGFVLTLVGFVIAQNRAATNRAVEYNKNFSDLGNRCNLLEQAKGFMQHQLDEHKLNNGRQLERIELMLEKIDNKLDDKADRGERI
jgi:hypothetical protein